MGTFWRIAIFGTFLFASNSYAQDAGDLPVDATGTIALPPVSSDVSILGAYFWGTITGEGVQGHIWGEAGEAIDSGLSAAGMSVKDDAGVFSFYVTFVFGSGIPVAGLITKEAGETLEEAFQREFAAGNLPEVGLAVPNSNDGGEGFGDNDLDPGGDPSAPPSDSLVFPPGAVVVIGGGSNGLWCGPGSGYICIY